MADPLGLRFRFGGESTLDLSGSVRRLVFDEIDARVIRITSATEACTLYFPEVFGGDWDVINDTAYNHTISSTSGGTTVSILASKKQSIRYHSEIGFYDILDLSIPGEIGATTPSIVNATKLVVGSDGLTFSAANTTPKINHTLKTASAATQAGSDFYFTAQHAKAGTSSASADRGADAYFYSGNAARYTSGNARGGNLILGGGAGIGTGVHGSVVVQPDLTSATDGTPFVVKNRSGSTKFYVDSNGVYSPLAAFDALTAKYVSGSVRADISPTSATLSTTDATPTTILTYTPTGKHGVLRFSGSAIDTATDRVKTFEKIVAFKVIAGVATVGTEKNLFDDSGTDRGIINGPMTACSLVSSAVGANVVFTFTGIAGTNIDSFICVEERSRT